MDILGDVWQMAISTAARAIISPFLIDNQEEAIMGTRMRNAARSCALILLLVLLAQGSRTIAQNQLATPNKQSLGVPGEDKENSSAGALQKETQNPVASLISVPVQNNNNFNVGSYNRTQDVLNIQPVIPIKLNDQWNLITRLIQPIIWQPDPSQNTGGAFGLGDTNPTFFLSPGKSGKLIWGAGPAFVSPTATSTILGQGKFSIGPSFVALTQPGHWTVGALVNNVFSVAGSTHRPYVNQMLLQYFINYNMKEGWYISISPILTANWRGSSGNVWTAPFGGGVGRIMKLGFQPVNLTAQFYGNAVYPTGTSPWNMRLQIAFLFPKLTREQEIEMMQKRLKQMEQQQPQTK